MHRRNTFRVIGLFTILILCFLKAGLSLETLMYFVFSGSLFALSVTDIERHIIPNECLYIIVANWAVYQILTGAEAKGIIGRFAESLIAGMLMLVVVISMNRLLKRRLMGGGDIKLIAVCVLYVGAVGGMFALLMACTIELLIQLPVGTGKNGKSLHFPFGPAISVGAFVVLLYGRPLIEWYLR